MWNTTKLLPVINPGTSKQDFASSIPAVIILFLAIQSVDNTMVMIRGECDMGYKGLGVIVWN